MEDSSMGEMIRLKGREVWKGDLLIGRLVKNEMTCEVHYKHLVTDPLTIADLDDIAIALRALSMSE